LFQKKKEKEETALNVAKINTDVIISSLNTERKQREK